MGQPTFYIAHGGGPCFFMEWSPPDAWNALRTWLEGLISALSHKPTAILVATAHWEADPVRVTAAAAPPRSSMIIMGSPPRHTRLPGPPRAPHSSRSVSRRCWGEPESPLPSTATAASITASSCPSK